MTILCQFINDEEGCDQEAKRVMRMKTTHKRGGLIPPWRNRVPFCWEHRQYLLNDPSVEIPWEDQGKVEVFPEDSLYQGVRSA